MRETDLARSVEAHEGSDVEGQSGVAVLQRQVVYRPSFPSLLHLHHDHDHDTNNKTQTRDVVIEQESNRMGWNRMGLNREKLDQFPRCEEALRTKWRHIAGKNETPRKTSRRISTSELEPTPFFDCAVPTIETLYFVRAPIGEGLPSIHSSGLTRHLAYLVLDDLLELLLQEVEGAV